MTVCVLADADVADFALIHQFFQLFPGRVRVRSELLIQYHVAFLLERDGPDTNVNVTLYFRHSEDAPVDQVEIEVLRVEFGEGLVQSRFDVFRGMERIPKLNAAGGRSA